MILVLLLILFVLLMVRTPLFVVIGTAAMLSFFFFVEGYETLASQRTTTAMQLAELTSKSVLLAIPFFVISGAIMTAGGIAQRLVAVADALVGHLRGGLAISAVLSCMIFAAISGSSVVTLIAVGSIMFPAMQKAGYRENFSLGLLTTAGSLGCLLPPSIPMLVYAISVTGSAAIEVGDLFLAGIGPALLIAGMLAVYSRFRGAPSSVAMRPRSSFAQVRHAFREGVWALLLPVIVLGGIGFGVFKNVTEAAAVSIVYAVTVELFIHRELRWKDLPPAILKSMSMMGALLLIIAISFALNAFMVEKGAAENFLEWIREQNMSPAGFLLAINIFLIVTGALMDSISAIVLFTPLIAPAAVALGIDPLHLGIVFIVNMEIGYVAPPIATNLFVSAQLFNKPFGQVVKSSLPTLGILCIGLVAVTYFPTVSIGPVYALKGGSFVQPFGGYVKGKKPGHHAPAALAGQPAAQAADAGTEPAAPMTMEEMMRRAKERREREEKGLPPEPEVAPEPGQPLSIQEMMQRAKEKREAEERAAAGSDSGM